MRPVIHGGDIYQNEIELDFSVNINPFGIPEKVKEAMQESLELCEHYPDIHHAKLIEKIGAHYHNGYLSFPASVTYFFQQHVFYCIANRIIRVCQK